MKRYVLSHVPMAIVYSLILFVIKTGWNNYLNWIWLLLGVIVGVLVLFLDRVAFTYSYPGAQISQQFAWYWKEHKYLTALTLLDARRLEQERLVFRSALFMALWVPLSFFALTSTGSMFGKGVVMGLMLHVLADAWRLQRSEPRRLHIRLFWMIKRVVSEEERVVFLWIMTLIFMAFSWWVG